MKVRFEVNFGWGFGWLGRWIDRGRKRKVQRLLEENKELTPKQHKQLDTLLSLIGGDKIVLGD